MTHITRFRGYYGVPPDGFSVEQGGTKNLDYIHESSLGYSGGIAKSTILNTVDRSNINKNNTLNWTSIIGPSKGRKGLPLKYKITNYGLDRTYDIRTSFGTISINGDEITFVATYSGWVSFSIGDRNFDVQVNTEFIQRPRVNKVVYSTDNGGTLSFGLTPFQIFEGADVHASTSFVLSDKSNFEGETLLNLVDQVSTNKNYSVVGFQKASKVFARASYDGVQLGSTDWGEKRHYQLPRVITGTLPNLSGGTLNAIPIVLTIPTGGSIKLETNSGFTQTYTSTQNEKIPSGGNVLTITGKGAPGTTVSDPGQPYVAPSNPYYSAAQQYIAPSNPYYSPGQPYIAPSGPVYSPGQPYIPPSDPYYTTTTAPLVWVKEPSTKTDSGIPDNRPDLIPPYQTDKYEGTPGVAGYRWLHTEVYGKSSNGARNFTVYQQWSTLTGGETTQVFAGYRNPGQPAKDPVFQYYSNPGQAAIEPQLLGYHNPGQPYIAPQLLGYHNAGQPYIAPSTVYTTGGSTTAVVQGNTYTFAGGYGVEATESSRTHKLVSDDTHNGGFGSSTSISRDGKVLIIGTPSFESSTSAQPGAIAIFEVLDGEPTLKNKFISESTPGALVLTIPTGGQIQIKTELGLDVTLTSSTTYQIPANSGDVTFIGRGGKGGTTLYPGQPYIAPSNPYYNEGVLAGYHNPGQPLITPSTVYTTGDPSKISYNGRNITFSGGYGGDATLQTQKILNGLSNSLGQTVFLTPSANMILSGAPNDFQVVENAGSLFVFIKDAVTNWKKHQRVVSPTPVKNALFGYNIASNQDGSRVFVSAVGENSVYYFKMESNNLVFKQKIQASDTPTTGFFGENLSCDDIGNTLVVGAPKKASGSNVGATYVFTTTDGNTFTQHSKLTPVISGTTYTYNVPGTGELLVEELNATGDVIASNQLTGTGTVTLNTLTRTFRTRGAGAKSATNNPTTVTYDGVVYSYPSAPLGKPDEIFITFPRVLAFKDFGADVDISADGTRIWTSAPKASSGFVEQGVVFSYKRVDNSWVEKPRYTSAEPKINGNFGSRIAVDDSGSKIVVGDPGGHNGVGMLCIIKEEVNGEFDVLNLVYVTTSDLNNFGHEVSISGNGELQLASNPNMDNNRGHVYLFNS